MADSFTISPVVLDWIKNAIDINELPEKQKKQFFSWLNKEKEPTFNQIKEFSTKSHIPFGYFFLSAAPKEEMPLTEYRTVNSTEFSEPSRDFIDLYYSMSSVQDWMINYLEEEGEAQKLDFVGKFRNNRNVSDITDFIRAFLDLDESNYLKAKDPATFNQLRNKISSAGVLVMQNGIVGNNTRRKLDINEFRGFALINKTAPLIFINAADTEGGKLFTLLHEFVHICIGAESHCEKNLKFSGPVKEEEQLSNAVAAELILPNKIFKEAWNGLQNIPAAERIIRIAERYRSGPTLVARKALEEGWISSETYNQISKKVINGAKKGLARKSGGDYYQTLRSRLDHNFLAFLNSSVEEGTTTYTEAFALTGTNSKTYPRLLERMDLESLR